MKSPVSGSGLAMFAIGTVFVYAGIKGYSVMMLIGNLVAGKSLATGASTASLLAPDSASTATVDANSTSASASPGKSGTPRALGMSQAAAMGWTGSEWDALDKLWNRESSWNPRAENPSSGAYGIPQALPYTKMPQSAWPERFGGHSDPSAQIAWGLSYIAGRYGTPSMAWAHEQSNNWY